MSDILWLLIAASWVFLMQAGFLCLETGRTRSKNNINVAAKNISDFIISAAVFWLMGFALLFGDSYHGLFGISGFFFGEETTAFNISFFLFQMMFCGTAATLTSGAIAERATFMGYLLVTVILSALVYPITGHWAWAGVFNGEYQGWLEAMGFVDFAGSTVVHSVGGWVALAAVLIIGPRIGRFVNGNRSPNGSNLPMAALGTMLIWFGWFGFNGGSTLELNERVPTIIINTCLSAIWGGLAASLLFYAHNRYVDVGNVLYGVIAGLVGVTASCHAVSPSAAAAIGLGSGVVLYYGTELMDYYHIDDALAVVPAHLFAGIWGTLAVGIFGDPVLLGTGLSQMQQLMVQLIGVVSIGAYSFIVSYVLMRLANRFVPLRVPPDDELRGLNVAEHQATTELIDLLTSMERQQHQGDFTTPVAEEPFTEVGQIAQKYNQVIAKVNEEIGLRDAAIDQFQASEKRKSAILDSSMDCIISVDRHGHIIEFNPAAERTFGCLKRQIKGSNFIEQFILPRDRESVASSLALGFMDSRGLVLNHRNRLQLLRSSTSHFPAEITITSTRLGKGVSSEYTLHIRDVTRQVKMQQRLQFLAYSDPLTSLSNRTYLIERLDQAIKDMAGKQTQIALLFLDLDKFKKINDTLGHKAGDELLCEVANRLTAVSRETDVITRWGGDEFVVMLNGNISPALLCEKADQILQAMRRPVEISGKTFNLPTSIGVVLNSDPNISAETVIQQADIAMYCAKQRGRDNFQFFTPVMAKEAAENFELEQALTDAIDSEQLRLVYQPKLLGSSQKLIGVEALMRWNHPQMGNIPPSRFIPLAEESNLIIKIGERVIRETVQQIKSWQDLNLQTVPVAVNVSGKHLISDELIPFIQQQLKEFGVSGHMLEIEITEGVLVQDIERCIDALKQLKELNIQVSVDDFGTGYSSLNYLKRMPLDVLKIDQSFVAECDTDEGDLQICSTIINLANNLGLQTVAEGVEREEQLTLLDELGCAIFQGYYFYKPLEAVALQELLTDQETAQNPVPLCS